jgi:hypothetical protein
VCRPQTSAVLSWRSAPGELSVADALGRVQLQASHFVRVCGTGPAPTSPPSGGTGKRAAPQPAPTGDPYGVFALGADLGAGRGIRQSGREQAALLLACLLG